MNQNTNYVWESRLGKCIAIALLLIPALTYAQPDCGTITTSFRLESDCIGPLVVGANNLIVDLNGYKVLRSGRDSDALRGGIEVFNKHGITVKNGTIYGYEFGLYVKGGQHNTFPKLVCRSVLEGGTFAQFEDVKNTMLSQISIRAYEDTHALRFTGKNSTLSHLSLSNVNGAPLASIQGKNLIISKSTFRGGFTGYCSPTSLRISNSTVTDNIFSGGIAYPSSGLCLQGSRNRVRHNSVVSFLGIGLTLEKGENNVISDNAITAQEENPPTLVDIDGGTDACKNRWSTNNFTTDSEGDGPDQGCIR